MITHCKQRIITEDCKNVAVILGDITEEETRETLRSITHQIDYISLFNLLHCENPTELLASVYNLLVEGGKLGVTHWNHADTPRGPSLDIRPKPEQIIAWASSVQFSLIKQVDLPPYHYGLVFNK